MISDQKGRLLSLSQHAYKMFTVDKVVGSIVKQVS